MTHPVQRSAGRHQVVTLFDSFDGEAGALAHGLAVAGAVATQYQTRRRGSTHRH
jgi:hypothetical protein